MGGGGGGGGSNGGHEVQPTRSNVAPKTPKTSFIVFLPVSPIVIRLATLESIWPLCRIYKYLFQIRTVDAFAPAFATFNLHRSQKGFQAISIPFEPVTSAAGRHASRTRLRSSSLCATWVISPLRESS